MRSRADGRQYVMKCKSRSRHSDTRRSADVCHYCESTYSTNVPLLRTATDNLTSRPSNLDLADPNSISSTRCLNPSQVMLRGMSMKDTMGVSNCCRHLRSAIVTLTITNRTSRAEYYIHAQVLCSESPYFVAMANFKEGDSNAVDLKEMDPRAFGVVANWFYCKTIPEARGWSDYELLVKAYGVAHRLIMATCRGEILQRLKNFCLNNKLQPQHLLIVAGLGLPATSGIVQFATDQLCYEMARSGSTISSESALDPADAELFALGGEFVVFVVEKMVKAFTSHIPKTGTTLPCPAADESAKYA